MRIIGIITEEDGWKGLYTTDTTEEKTIEIMTELETDFIGCCLSPNMDGIVEELTGIKGVK